MKVVVFSSWQFPFPQRNFSKATVT